MHKKITEFLKKHSDKCPKGSLILDIGSLNVNGNAAQVLPVTVGVDMREGKGVDLVCNGEDLLKHFDKNYFDVIVTTDTLEHVKYWREFLIGAWSVLKPDGIFIATIASKRKGRHAYPDDYWRLEKHHLIKIFGDLEDYQDLGISTGWVVRKFKDDLGDLKDIHLDPVDKKVPKELLG